MYVRPSDGSGVPQMLTKDGKGYRYQPTCHPIQSGCTTVDKTGAMWLYNFESKESKQFDREPSAGPTSPFSGRTTANGSCTLAMNERIPRSAIWVYNVLNGTKRKLTNGFFNDIQSSL